MYYFQHHIGDYLRDTASLTLLEHGIYFRLIQEYHKNESPLCGDIPREIGARTQEEKNAVAYVLERYFKRVKGKYHNVMYDKTIADYKSNLEKNRINGRLGGRPRIARSLISEKKPKAKATKNQKPSTKNQKSKNQKHKKASDAERHSSAVSQRKDIGYSG